MRILILVASTLLVLACNGDNPPASDLAARDRGPSSDQPSSKELGAREAGKPDRVLDLSKPKDDVKPPADLPALDQQVADLPADPCATVKCALKNDCCDCEAYSSSSSPPPCAITNCKQPTCGALGIKQPIASCLKGHCLVLSDEPASCVTDKECKVVDDCCACTALPAAAQVADCKKMCLINTCQSWGLGAAKARCLGGLCRLVP